MSYATKQDFLDRYDAGLLLLLTDRDASGQVDDAVLDRAIEDAMDEIDGYVGARYTLPLAEPPSILKRLTVDVALYRLSSESDALTEERRTRYNDAVKLLVRISRGEVTLGEPVAEPPTAHRVRTAGQPKRFTRDSMTGLRI